MSYARVDDIFYKIEKSIIAMTRDHNMRKIIFWLFGLNSTLQIELIL